MDAATGPFDSDQCKEMLGADFDQTAFDALKDAEGKVTHAQITAALAEAAALAAGGDAAAAAAAGDDAGAADAAGGAGDAGFGGLPKGVALVVSPETLAAASAPAPEWEEAQKFHSMVRWNKPAEEMQAALAGGNEALVNSVDAQNGNYPIHLAAQNGHFDMCNILVANGCDINAKNGSGHTALHMSVEYGYFWQSKFLAENGADLDITNNEGHAARTGNEGGKNAACPLSMVTDAKSGEHIDLGLAAIKANRDSVDTVEMVQGVMAKKKSMKSEGWGDEWNAARQDAFKQCM